MKRRHKKQKQLNRSKIGNAGINVILTVLGAFMLLPMIYTISSALKPLDELWVFPPRFLVRNPTTKNFSDLFRVLLKIWTNLSIPRCFLFQPICF